MANANEGFLVLPRLVPPTTAVLDRPFIAAFHTVFVEKLKEPRLSCAQGRLYRNSAGTTKIELLQPNTPEKGVTFAQRWSPSDRKMEVYVEGKQSIWPASIEEVWLPRGGTGPLVHMKRTDERRLIHGQECRRIQLWLPEEDPNLITNEVWICEELAIVMSDMVETRTQLSHWELNCIDLQEPDPESLDLPGENR